MADDLHVDTDVIRDNSYRMDSVADTVARARDRLVRRLDQLGPCWGHDDEVAHAFAQQYVPGRDQILHGTEKVGTLMYDLGDRSRQASHGYATAEEVNQRNAAT